jgi:hypothetical protein
MELKCLLGLFNVEITNRTMVSEEISSSEEFSYEVYVSIILHEPEIFQLYSTSEHFNISD